jgi:hypothetical protein
MMKAADHYCAKCDSKQRTKPKDCMACAYGIVKHRVIEALAEIAIDRVSRVKTNKTLTRQWALEIIDGASHKALATKYGVSPTTIARGLASLEMTDKDLYIRARAVIEVNAKNAMARAAEKRRQARAEKRRLEGRHINI